MQKIMYAFMGQGPRLLIEDPFIAMRYDTTEFTINTLKENC